MKEVLSSVEDNKAPSLDGHIAGFFKHAWDLIGKDFYQAILEFFRNAKLLK